MTIQIVKLKNKKLVRIKNKKKNIDVSKNLKLGKEHDSIYK